MSYSLQSCDTSICSVLCELSVSFSTLVVPGNREDAWEALESSIHAYYYLLCVNY